MQDKWQSRTGFILATIGAAVGLGSIWRFAYVVGENGGATFLLVYLAMIALICVPLVIAELALGRRGASDAVTAFEAAVPGGRWKVLGAFGVIGAALILTYYAVIAGWALRYFATSLTGALWSVGRGSYEGHFQGFIGNGFEPVLWQGLMLAVTAIVVGRGVNAGIERLNMWLMPLLAVVVLLLAAYVLRLPGAWGGVTFLFTPDWSALARPSIYLAALGQAFFSIGIGMAVFVTYGGYLTGGIRIPGATVAIVVVDTLFSIAAGLAVFPAVFAFGLDPASGPRLAFVIFPEILQQMPLGRIIGPLFFFLLSAAALASMISLLEAPVAYAVHRRGMSRSRATTIAAVAVFIGGMPSALSYGLKGWLSWRNQPLLDLVDQGISNFVLPVSGLLIALLVGWRMERSRVLADADLAGSPLAGLWLISVRVLAPVMILIVLLRSLGVL